MEAETNSPEDASAVSVPSVKSIKNIGSEEIIFLQKLENDVNSKYPLVEEKGKADTSKTDEVSEIRPQESCKVCVEGEEQAEPQPEEFSIEKILKHKYSEELVMSESIPKLSEHEDESMSTIPELAIKHSEMAEKIGEEERYKKEEESTAIDNDQSCRPQNELEQTSKALEAIDQTQFMAKDTTDYEHTDHQSEAPSMENVITKHSNLEEKLPRESSIKSNYDEEPLEKNLELYSVDDSEIKNDGKIMSEKAIDINEATEVELQISETKSVPEDGTLKTLSTTACVAVKELENKDDGKFTHETAQEAEAATEMQLLESATDSLPEEEVQPRLRTAAIVQQETDQIIKQQPLNQDQPDVIDNANSRIAEKEIDRVSTVIEEPAQLETKDHVSIVKEQAVQQPEETSMQSVTINYIIGHTTSESSTKLLDDVHESHSIKNLDKKDANEIREEEATDAKQSTNGEIPNSETKVGTSEDKALQTLSSAELVGNKAIEESCREDIKPEAERALAYANEEQRLQHEVDTKEEIPEEEACELTAEIEQKSEHLIAAQNNETTCIKHPYLAGETTEIKPTNDTVEQEVTMFHTKERLAIEDDEKFQQEEVKGTEKETKVQLQNTTESLPEEEIQIKLPTPCFVQGDIGQISQQEKLHNDDSEAIGNANKSCKPEIELDGKSTIVEKEKGIEEATKTQLPEEEAQKRSPSPTFVEGDTHQIQPQETFHVNKSEVTDNAKQICVPEIELEGRSTVVNENEQLETKDNGSKSKENLDNKDAHDIRAQEGGTNAKQLTDVEIPKTNIEGVPLVEALQSIPNAVSIKNKANNVCSQEEKQSEAEFTEKFNNDIQTTQYYIGETAENDTTNDAEEKEEVPASHPDKAEDDGKFKQETKGIESTKTQLPDEEVQRKSHTPAFVQGDNDQDPQQELSRVDESELIDNANKSCIPEIELHGKLIPLQETEKPETKDNVGIVTENLDNKDESDIGSQEGTDAKLYTDAEIPNPETEGTSKDEALQPLANAVSVGIKAVDESSQEEIQLEADVTVKSNTEVKRSEYVTEGAVEINAINYTNEQDGIENDGKFSEEEEAKGIEEATKMQLQEGETKQSCIPEIELDGNSIIVQETEKDETKDNVGMVTENLDNKDANDIILDEETDAKELTNVEIPKSKTEGVPKDEPIQPIARALSIGIKAHDKNSKEEVQPEADATVKSNKEVQRPEYVTVASVEINATNYSEEQEQVPKSYVLEKEGIGDEFSQEEEATNTQLQEKEAHTRSPTPAFVHGDYNQIPQQETLHLNESKVIDNAKQSCVPEIKLDENSIIVQKTEKPETKDNVTIVADNLDNKIAINIKSEEGTNTKQFTDMEIPESETQGVPKDEQIQPIARAVLVRTEAHDESSPEEIQREANVTVKSNLEVQKSHVIEKEGIWDNGKCGQVEEAKRILEPIETHLQVEEVLTRSPTAASVQGDINQIPQQETLYIDESEATDTAKQGCIAKIAQDIKLNIDQETDKPETKDNVGTVTEKLENKDASDIRLEEETDATQLTNVEVPKSEIKGASKNEAQQQIAYTVLVGTEVVDEGSQEEIQSEADAKVKCNEEEQRPEYVTEGTAEINATNYTKEKEEVPTFPVDVKEGIENDGKFSNEEESKGVEQETKMQLQEEEAQTRSPTPAFVKDDTNQIPQQETVHIDELEVFYNAKQRRIPPIELDKKTTVVQETRNPETKDKVSIVAENLDNKDATKIKAVKGTYVQQPSDLEIPKSKRGVSIDEAQQPIANAVSVRSKALDGSSQEEIQPEAYVTEKSNKAVPTTEYATDEVVEINTNNYTEKEEVPKSDAGEREMIEDKFNQEKKVEGIEEAIKTQLLEEEGQIKSSTLALVQGDTNQILHQTLHVDESEVIDNATVVQETEVSETKDNAGRVIENLEKEANEISAEEGIDAKQLTYLEMSKSETKEGTQGDRKSNQKEENRIEEITEMQTPQEEVHTTSPTPAFAKDDIDKTPEQKTSPVNESNVIANAKQRCIPEFELDRNSTVVQEIEVSETKNNVNRVVEKLDKPLNECSEQDKQPEADVTDKSNKNVKTPEYVTEENVEINITNYAGEKDNNPTDHAKDKEGIEDMFNQEEKSKSVEETTKTHSAEGESSTRSHAPALVQDDTNQIPHQETMHVDESEVIDNAKLSYIPEIELDGKVIVVQETEVFEVSESSHKKDATEIREEEEIDAKQLTDLEMPKSETEGVPEDETIQPIAEVILIGTEAVEESSKEETQPTGDVTDKFNREVLIQQFVAEETLEININNYTEEQDKHQTSHAKEQDGTEDDGKLDEEEAKANEEETKTQFPEEEFQTRSPIPTSVQGDTGQILQQETVNINESDVLDNDKQSCIPEIELDGKSTVVQETNNPETKHNVSTGAESLDNKDAIEVREEEETYVKHLINEEIPKSETKGVPKDEAPYRETLLVDGSEVINNVKQSCIPEIKFDGNSTVVQETEKPETKNIVNIITKNFDDKGASEIRAEEGTYDKQLTEVARSKSITGVTAVPEDGVLQPIAIAVTIGTKTIDDNNQIQIQLKEVTEKKSNKEEQTSQYIAEDTEEINTNEYDKVQKNHGKVNGENLDQEEEAKDIEQTRKMQGPEEEVQKRPPTPPCVQGETDKISQQEIQHVDESEAIDYVTKSCILEIELNRKSTIVQETEKPEIKHNVSLVKQSSGTNDASYIRAAEGTDTKKWPEPKSEIKDVPEDDVPQALAITVAVRTETFEASTQEKIQLEQDITEKKSNEEEETPQYVAENTAETNTNNYTKEHDKVKRFHPKVKEEMEDDENFNQEEEAKGIEETSKIQLPEEEIQTGSPTAAFVQGNTDQISQQDLLNVDESAVIDYVEQSNIPEIALDRKSTIVQETEKRKTKNNDGIVTGDLGTNDASDIRTKEGIDAKKLADLKIPKSEIEAIVVAVGTQTVDDSNKEQIQLEEDETEKSSNEEEQRPQYVAENTAEINTNNYNEEHDKVQTFHAKIKEGTEDNENFDQEKEAKSIEEKSQIQLAEEEVKIRLPTPAFVQGDADQISHQELLPIDEAKVNDYEKQSCVPEIELDRKFTIAQETEKLETKSNDDILKENLGTNYASDIMAEEGTETKKLANLKMQKSEIKDLSEDEVSKPITIAAAAGNQTVCASNQKQIQLEGDGTEKKSNKDQQTPQYVAENTAEKTTNNYTEENDKDQTFHLKVKEGIEDDENFDQEKEAKGIEDTSKMQLPEDEIQTRSPISSLIQGNTDQISQQELLHVDESEVIDYVKQSCIPEIETDRKSAIVQETEKHESKDNVGSVKEKLDTNNASIIRIEEGTEAKKLAYLKMSKSEIEDVPEDEVAQPIETAVAVRTKKVDDTNPEQIQLEEDITEKQIIQEEQTPQYVVENAAEINTNNYTEEHDKDQTYNAKGTEGIKDAENFDKEEEAKGIEETSKMQLPQEEVHTRSLIPVFIQGDTDQISQQELLHVDESEVIDYVKQSCIPEIELERKSTIVQETEKPETKDTVGMVTENLGTNYACEIRTVEGTDAKKLADLKMPMSEIDDVPEVEVLQPIEIAVAVKTKTVDYSNQEQIYLEEDTTLKKSIKEEQTPQYVAEDTAEINTNKYTDEQDKVQTSHAQIMEGIDDDENFDQEEAKGIEETGKMHSPEEEIQTRSPNAPFIQGKIDQISQQELLPVDESELIDYVKQRCIPEIELDRKFTIVQETEKPETKDNVSIVTDNLGTNDASQIKAEEGTEAKEFADLKMLKSEIKAVPKDESLKPRANTLLVGNEAVETSNQQDIQLEAKVIDKSNKEVQTEEYVTEETVEINIDNYVEENDKNPTSHAEGKEGIKDIFNQEEKAKVIEESTKAHSAEEEVQTRSPTPAFVQSDTNQIPHQETLHVNESEVIDNAKLSCIPEIELDEKAIVFQRTEKVETKDNFYRVMENLNKDESENKAEEGRDVRQLTDLEKPKLENKGVLEDESLQPIPDTVSVGKEAVIVNQEKRKPQEEFIENFNKEMQTPQYLTEEMPKIETTNDTEEQEEVPPSHPKEKLGIKDDGKFEEVEEKRIEEETKTQLQEEDIKTTLPIPTLIQGDFDQILQQQTLHDDESKVIGNAKSCKQEIELQRKSTIVEVPHEPETKDHVNIIKQKQANNQSEKSRIERDIANNITAEGLITSERNRKISDTDGQKTVESYSRENLDNKNVSEINVEKASEARQSTYVEIPESEIQGEPEDKALQTIPNLSSIGNKGLDENSPEERQKNAEFTENFNKDVQIPQRNTKVTAETSIANCPDKQQEVSAQLPGEENRSTLPTPTFVQGDIDQMAQQQTLNDDETEVIDNAKSCMTEIELDRRSTVVEEPKQPETKANVDLVKDEQAYHQSEESSEQSFITNYLIVERHMTSERNTELSVDVDFEEQKRAESHLVDFSEIKDASEIRAKGTHSKQLTEVEILKSETEGVAEDKGLQTTLSATSVKIYASNECCQEEIQPQEEYAETRIEEVKTSHYEFEMQNHIPEEDTSQVRVENEQELKAQPAPPNKETTFIDNLYSEGEIAKTNPISDIEEEVNPKSHTKEKLLIQDDSKFNEEEVKVIEETTKVKLLSTATESPPEVQPKLPAPATVQGDTDQILLQQTLHGDESDTIDNDTRCIPENELDRVYTVSEEPETKVNIDIVEEEQSDKQSQGASMQSLITDYITAEGHLATESNSKLGYDMNEQKTVNLQMVENLGIESASKMTVEETTDAKQPTGVEKEKTKNEGVLDFKAKTLTNSALVKNETLDNSNQVELQPEEKLSGTYTKDEQTPQPSMEKVMTKHINSEGMEIIENSTKSSYDEEEQDQVIDSYTIKNSEIKDGRKNMLEEASDIKEATDVHIDGATSNLSTMPSVRIGIVDESIQEKIQKEVQPAVINTKEEQRPEYDFGKNMEVLEAFDLQKVPGNTCVENEEKVEVQSEANNQETIKKHLNLEELETAEISLSSDTKGLGKELEVAKLGGVSASVSVDITEQIDTGKLETQEAETAISGNTKENKAVDEFEKISPSSSAGVISRDSQDTGTKVLHKKSNGILSGVGSKVKHSISKVKKVITGKSSRPKTPPPSK